MALSSKEYWARREAEQLKHNITEEAAYSKEIDRIYADMLDNIQTQIDGFYGRYAARERITLAEAKKRVKNIDIEAYERKAKKYVAEKNFSKHANEEMRLYNATMRINRLELLKANIGLEMIAGHDELEKYMEGILQGRTMDELQRQAGILGKSITNNAKTAHAIVNGSFHSGTFSDRIWQYQDMMRIDLSRLLETGLIQGKNPRAIAKGLREYWYGKDPATGGGARYCMERLMRTELARVQTEAQKQSFERNGYEEYIFIVNGDCCPICEETAKKDTGRGAGVYLVSKMMPGENAPPMHPHCRCSTAAHMNRAEFDKWLDSVANGGTTEEWEAAKQKRLTNSVNGNKIEMYRKGATHRKTSLSGAKIIDKATYNKITKPAIKAGADIRIANGEWLERLKIKNSSAVTIGDVIYFKPDATVSDVLEEVHHFYQNKKGLNDNYFVTQREIMNEIDAKKYLLSVAEKYKIPAEETELTKNQLENYIKDMERMKERGEWVD